MEELGFDLVAVLSHNGSLDGWVLLDIQPNEGIGLFLLCRFLSKFDELNVDLKPSLYIF